MTALDDTGVNNKGEEDRVSSVTDLRARLAAGRGGLLARIELVTLLIASGDVDGAVAEAREAVFLHPGAAPASLAFGEALLAAQNLPAAIGEFQRALRADPDIPRAHYLIGRAWLEAGEADKALEIFAALDPVTLDLEADIARARAIQAAQRSDPGYVRHLFDQFSADYDSRMVTQLAYAAPEILLELAGLAMPGRTGLAVLDLGCGTGLAGARFKPLSARLDGVDLSPAMIAKARARGIYHRLAVDDLEAALAREAESYDLILAADTLVYLGNLDPVFAGAARALKPEGYFLFTVEVLPDGETAPGFAPGFALGPKRRWRHGEAYLREAGAGAGLHLAGLVACAPRSEANQPVAGLAAAFSRA